MILANIGVKQVPTVNLPYEYLFDIPLIGIGEIGFSCQRLNAANTQFGLVQRSSDSAIDTLLLEVEGSFNLNSSMLGGGTLGTWAQGGDVRVKEWYNQGDGGNLIQNTIANQPYIVTAGVLEVKDGKSAVYFNGNQWMVNTGGISLTQPNAWNILMNFIDKGTQLNHIPFDSDGTGSGRQIPIWLDDFILRFKYYIGSNQEIANVIFDTRINLFADLRTPLQEEYINNVALSVPYSGTNTLTGLTLGARYTFSSEYKGYMQEVTAWDTDKSAERTAIYNNVVNRY